MFDDVVRSALDTLPPHIAAGLRNVAVVVEDENAGGSRPLRALRRNPADRGRPGPGDLPNRIAIYRRPLEDDFPDDDELREEIRITVLHELGHYFGLDEDRLSELGYE